MPELPKDDIDKTQRQHLELNPSIIIHSSHPVNNTTTSACLHLSKYCVIITPGRTSRRESEIHKRL